MSAAAEPHLPPHLLSTRSITDGRDTFIFCKGLSGVDGIYLLAGFNRSTVSITGAQFYRWFRALGCPHDYTLCKAKVTDFEVLRYQISEEVSEIPSDSVEQLEAGDYYWFAKGSSSSVNDLPSHEDSLSICVDDMKAKMSRLVEEDDNQEFTNQMMLSFDIPDEIRSDITGREHTCFFTDSLGTQEGVEVSWVFPPSCGHELAISYDLESWSPQLFMRRNNAILMRSDLVRSFLDNDFGVDIEDNYRIVIFNRSKLGTIPLPSNLPLKSRSRLVASLRENEADDSSSRDDETVNSSSRDDEADNLRVSLRNFLHQHFLWCLKVHLLGGDVSDQSEYRWDKVEAMVIELNEYVNEGGAIENLSQDKWVSPLGKEVIRWLEIRDSQD